MLKEGGVNCTALSVLRQKTQDFWTAFECSLQNPSVREWRSPGREERDREIEGCAAEDRAYERAHFFHLPSLTPTASETKSLKNVRAVGRSHL